MIRSGTIPVLMRDAEVISLKEAAYRSGRSEKTISRWCISDGIGRRSSPSAPWEISAIALEAKRYGDQPAIEALRRGEFEAVEVKRYVGLLGLVE